MPSEYGEDIWIRENLSLPETGFYVDLGCAWPVVGSNTDFLRRLGWSGVVIDGNPAYAKNWEGVAPFICAVLGDGNPVQFEVCPCPDLSRVGSGPVVPTRRLDDILKDYPAPTFLSCDLEGQEFTALSTYDWTTKPHPLVIVSEYNTLGIGEDFRVRDMLLSLGYKVRHQTIANLVYSK